MKNIKCYRKSSYVISICVNDVQKQYMLIHGFTGALDIVSEDIASLFLQDNINSPLPEWLSDNIFQLLEKRGYITLKLEAEEHLIANKIAAAIHGFQRRNGERFYFIVNYNCNFRCPYCYENYISNKGKNWSRQIMTKNMADRAFDSMSEIEPDKTKHFKEVVLYGGEPLMAENVEIMNYVVHKGSKLGYNFTAITNGYDLELFENLLGKDLIERLQITLDGDEKDHNKRRFHYLKGASYQKIMSNVRLALDRGVFVRIRSNIDGNNIESVKRLMKDFEVLGFYKYKNFSFYPALLENHLTSLIDKSQNHLDFLSPSDFEGVSETFLKRERGYSLLISAALNAKKPLSLQPSHCGANKGMYILDPNGDIYCCLEAVGLKEQIIGHYGDNLEWTQQFENWKGRSVNTIPGCLKCRYALICGGGCSAKILHKGLQTPSCNNFPIVLELNARKAYRNFCMQ